MSKLVTRYRCREPPRKRIRIPTQCPSRQEKQCPTPQLRSRRTRQRFPKLQTGRRSPPRSKVEAKRESSVLGLSSSFSLPASYSSPCSSLLFDIGLRFTPARFTVGRTST